MCGCYRGVDLIESLNTRFLWHNLFRKRLENCAVQHCPGAAGTGKTLLNSNLLRCVFTVFAHILDLLLVQLTIMFATQCISFQRGGFDSNVSFVDHFLFSFFFLHLGRSRLFPHSALSYHKGGHDSSPNFPTHTSTTSHSTLCVIDYWPKLSRNTNGVTKFAINENSMTVQNLQCYSSSLIQLQNHFVLPFQTNLRARTIPCLRKTDINTRQSRMPVTYDGASMLHTQVPKFNIFVELLIKQAKTIWLSSLFV